MTVWLRLAFSAPAVASARLGLRGSMPPEEITARYVREVNIRYPSFDFTIEGQGIQGIAINGWHLEMGQRVRRFSDNAISSYSGRNWAAASSCVIYLRGKEYYQSVLHTFPFLFGSGEEKNLLV